MSKLTEAVAAGVRQHGPTCSIRQLLERLPEDESKELAGLLADEDVMSTVLMRALRSVGHKVGVDAVRRHRARECRCD